MLGEFSYLPMLTLLKAGIDVRGAIVSMPSSADDSPISIFAPEPHRFELPLVNPFAQRNIASLARESGLPVLEVRRLKHPDTLAAIADLKPDVACAACFPKRIPAPMLTIPPHGFLNIHPSRLPAYRGPEPLFWQFRNGESSIGVTIHFMDEALDTGDIVLQTPLELPDGIAGPEASRICAVLGGQLLVEALKGLKNGKLSRRRQPEGGSHFPAPAAEDFTLSVEWPARRAFNFMRGTAAWGQKYRIDLGDGRTAWLQSASSYAERAVLEHRYVVSSMDEIAIQFNPGVLQASLVGWSKSN
jgi:methionyl-tRNA formyltransferase